MRDVMIVLLMFGMIPWALRKPIVAAVLYVIVSVMQPHKLTWGFATSLPWAWVFGGVMLVSIMARHVNNLPRAVWQMKLPLVFLLWTIITAVFALDQSVSVPKILDFIKFMLAFLFVMMAVNSGREVTIILLTVVLSVGFYALKGSIWVVATLGSYSLAGPPDTAISDRNSLAVAFVMIIPIVYWLTRQVPKKWQRIGLYAVLCSCIIGTVGTYSRGGFLTLVIVGAFFLFRSKAKLASILLIIPVAFAAFLFMPDKYFERLNTVKTYQQDESALGRINAWKAAISVADDRLTGAGAMFYLNPINFTRYAPTGSEVLTAHSIYFQALGEHGWLGLFLFVSIFGSIVIRLRYAIRKEKRRSKEVTPRRELLSMLELSIFTYLLGGAFLSLVYWEAIYLILGVTYFVISRPDLSFKLEAPPEKPKAQRTIYGRTPQAGKETFIQPVSVRPY
jgi:putative inorganic carbon (hco3(-)) transporter